MNASIKCFSLITTLLLGITWSLQAQHFSNGSTISDALLSGREWHISSKIDGFPLVSLLNGGAGVVSDQPLTHDRTFIIEDGPDDGDGWTADVRWFHIRNRNNNLYLTVQGTSAGSAIGWDLYHETAGTGMWQQQFRLIATEVVGWYKLRSRLSQDGPDLVLTVGGDGMLTVQAPDMGASLDQKFAFNLAVPLDPSTNYMILGINNNDYISDQGISTDHTPVVHVEGFDYSCYWNFVFAGGNYLYIVNALTGNYLSNSGSSSAGDPLYMDQNPSENAKWSLLRRDATWSFQNKQSGYLISTKGQTGNRDPIFQSTSSGIGIKWALLPITQQDPEYLTGDYQHMLDGAAPMNDCLEYGLQFQLALCERVGLPADDQYFNVLVDAVNEYYGDEILARQALQHFDLNNTGHRAELSFALRNYMVGTLAHKSPQQLTQPEMDLLTIFTDKVRLLRLLYAQRLAASAVEFEESINSGNIHLLSELLDNLNASDFVWPGEYEPGSYQQHVMEEYASATKTLGLNTNHQELGINIAMLIEPLAVPGIGVALTLSIKTGVSALAPAVDYTLAAEAVKAAQAAVRTTVAAGANAGTVITVAMIAAQLIAQEAMEAQEVTRLGKRIIERIQWGQYWVDFRTIMTGADELAKLKLLSDLDYLMGAPLDQPFQHNTNDNSITTAFSLDCKSNVTVDLENNGTITLSPVMVLNSFALPVCGGEIGYNFNASQFDCDDLGSHLVTLTAANSSLSLACNTTVTIQDHTAPSITWQKRHDLS